jgi:hypothetical protein
MGRTRELANGSERRISGGVKESHCICVKVGLEIFKDGVKITGDILVLLRWSDKSERRQQPTKCCRKVIEESNGQSNENTENRNRVDNWLPVSWTSASELESGPPPRRIKSLSN